MAAIVLADSNPQIFYKIPSQSYIVFEFAPSIVPQNSLTQWYIVRIEDDKPPQSVLQKKFLIFLERTLCLGSPNFSRNIFIWIL